MSSLESGPPAVPVGVENPDDFAGMATGLSAIGLAGLTLETLAGFVATAVPLLFACDARRDFAPLRGVFADPVVAQCEQHAGALQGAQPLSVSLRIAALEPSARPPALRVHVAAAVSGAADGAAVLSQFWDIAANQQVVVGRQSCPNCGGPVAGGMLACPHCGADVRTAVSVPFLVERMQLY